MKAMKHAMQRWCNEHPGGYQDDQTREKCITTSKDLTGHCMQLIHRPHSPKNHRGVEKRIEPGKMFQSVITEDADR